MNLYEFYTGKEFEAYKYLGAHWEADGLVFRTFAPGAERVSLIAECGGWQEVPMYKVHDGNFYECRVSNGYEGMMYKYRIYAKRPQGGGTYGKRPHGAPVSAGREHGESCAGNPCGGYLYVDHCDPYGFGMELRPGTASIVRNLETYRFTDAGWMRRRSTRMNLPLNIYEVHAGSWRRKNAPAMEDEQLKGGRAGVGMAGAAGNRADDGAGGSRGGQIGGAEGPYHGEWYNYVELAELLIPYLKEMGYNYVEFMPLAEHPCDESWGYQGTGFFAPTSRYGTAEELQRMVGMFHAENIGVLIDFVPVHFAVDGYALANYDGTPLYEYPTDDVGYNEWGSKNFCHGRGEVGSFLQSAANYWLNEYHFDGLRMDAISNMIYWQGDMSRGVNKGAVDFIKNMNQGLKERHPGCILAAEDSTSYVKVTAPVQYGGLGFDYKWDMGWMNDTLDYFRGDPLFRGGNYNGLTFSMMYFYQENYILPLSHDEVVHGKATILQKMFGLYGQKFPQARAFYMYMYVHPGKKLNFMGNEFAQLREWDEGRQQDWEMLRFPIHDAFHHYIKELNHLYVSRPELYAEEMAESGFEWLDCHQQQKCIYAIRRNGGGRSLMAVFNFSGNGQDYELRLPEEWIGMGGREAQNGEKERRGAQSGVIEGRGARGVGQGRADNQACGHGLRLLLHSDWERFSGTVREGGERFAVDEDGVFRAQLPAFSGMLFEVG